MFAFAIGAVLKSVQFSPSPGNFFPASYDTGNIPPPAEQDLPHLPTYRIGPRGMKQRRDYRGKSNQAISVRREKALVHSGKKTGPGTGSLHPVAIGAAVEVTKPPRPPV